MTDDAGTVTERGEAGVGEAVEAWAAVAPTPDPGEIAAEPASHGAGVADVPAEPVAEVLPESVEAPVPVSTPEAPVVELPAVASEPPHEIAPAASHGAQPSIPTPASNSLRDTLRKGLEKIRFRKRAKLEKVVALAREKGSIKNDDVEKLLHVSDSTAQRYLKQLVQDGKLKASGSTISTIYTVV